MGEREPGKPGLPPELDTEARSNAIYLTGRQWLGVGLFAVAMVLAGPTLWKNVEKLELEPDYRIPKDLSSDYWLFERFTQLAASRYETLVCGDSVVWGEYVTRQHTLSHYLNDLAGKERFANLGLDGAHPLALAGLLEFYSADARGKNIVLQCNPLWLSSPKADLRVEEGAQVNHTRLLPQLFAHIPSYPGLNRLIIRAREQISPRIGIVVEQRLAFSGWATHLQQVYFDQKDVPAWTLEHPYDNPIKPLTRGLPPADDVLRHEPISWTARGIKKQDYEWVDLETSLQWQAFRRAVELLQRRGNRVFVLVGPFNEHLLSQKNRNEYHRVERTIVSWLQVKKVPHLAPPPLVSELYADASHPLAAGYALLARQVFDSLSK